VGWGRGVEVMSGGVRSGGSSWVGASQVWWGSVFSAWGDGKIGKAG